jgi:hypothetical protein
LYITEETRHDVYIKIIEMDDDTLLDDLDDYLKAKSTTDRMYKFYRKYKKIKEELKYTKTIDEANKLFEEFITT